MEQYRIRTSQTDSVKGIASTQHVDVNLKQTAKTLPFPNVSDTLSQRSVYEQERKACENFRLILTVVPYCSNVLFNSLTEIIKNEGSKNVTVITDTTNAKYSVEGSDEVKEGDTETIEYAIGNTTPRRIQMVANSEYTSEQHGGYEYHPGYDFFDNHILRNKSFKIVNDLGNNNNKEEYRKIFNTIEDYARDRDGNILRINKRTNINDLSNFQIKKHLYIADDIMSIDDSINQNLYEDNGWWGFTNNTAVDSKKLEHRKWYSLDISKAINNHKACEFIDMYPDRSLFSFAPKFNEYTHQNEYNWNVVLTYPYKNDYTHPLILGGSSYIKRSMDDDGNIVEETISDGNRWTGLKVLNVNITTDGNITFRTYTKHGLEQGDMFYVYYTNPYFVNEDEEDGYLNSSKFGKETLKGMEVYYESEAYYRVTNVGNLSKKYDDYFFYTSNLSLATEIYEYFLKYVEKCIQNGGTKENTPLFDEYNNDDKSGIYQITEEGAEATTDGKTTPKKMTLKTDLLNKLFRYTNFRIRRCVRGIKSVYYLRQFRKIPNLCAAQREMTEEEALHIAKFNDDFDNYVFQNAADPTNSKRQRDFKNETYQLGFSSSIYNDNVAQMTFTDGISVKGLTDNLGRPLTEIYCTVVKNNAGHEVWYHNTKPLYTNEAIQGSANEKDEFKKMYGVDYDGYKIEYSHCFGKVTSGIETFIKSDDTEQSTAPDNYWKKLSSIHHISNIINKDGKVSEDNISNNLDTDLKYYDTFFYGDLTEFNSIEFSEKHIAKVMHRFNTAQRETINNPHYSQYQYHEITEDDYDMKPFSVTEYSAVGGIADEYNDKTGYTTTDYPTISRPEGYYYQAHYPIAIREYTTLQQGYNRSLNVSNAKPVQRGGILIQIKTRNIHKLSNNDTIYIYDEDRDIVYVTKCVQVIDKTTFLMSPNYEQQITNANSFESRETKSNLKDSTETYANKNVNPYKERLSWLELCDILNGKYEGDLTYPSLKLKGKNPDIPDYATYVGDNRYVWKDIVNIGDSQAKELSDYVFANGYFYLTNKISFYLKRQDPFGISGLYFDGEEDFPYFPNDPSGDKQAENNNITKDTTVSC
jgi:hypothetical protein